MAAYAVAFYCYVDQPKRKYLYATFLFLILAALTKGIESLIFIPSLLIYAVYKRRLLLTIRTRAFYFGCLAFLLFVPGYYLLREHYNPGYIAAVIANELGGRFTNVIESHTGDGFYYYDLLVGDQFRYWYLLVIPGIITGLLSKHKMIKDLTFYSGLLAISYFGIISAAKTKLDWYSMPMFPFLAVLSGIFIWHICKLLAVFHGWKAQLKSNPLPLIFLFLVFFLPYQVITRSVLANTSDPYMNDSQKNFKNLLKEVLHKDRNLDGAVILNEGFDADISWYGKAMKQEHIPVTMLKYADMPANCKVVAFNLEYYNKIEKTYNFRLIDTFKTVRIYQLYGVKQLNN